jgi:hypothetical protein
MEVEKGCEAATEECIDPNADNFIQANEALERCKKQIKKELSCQLNVLNFNGTHGKQLDEMKALIENEDFGSSPIDEELFYEYENKLCHLRHTNRNLKKFDCKDVYLNVFDYFSDETVSYIDHTFQTIPDRLRSSLYGVIDIERNYCTSDMRVVSNKLLLTANFTSLSLYDEKLELVRKVKGLLACYVATNKVDRIYVTGCRKLILMDFDFKTITEIQASSGEFSFGHLTYFNHALYVCDPVHQRIHKYSSNLELQKSYSLQFNPEKIEIVDGIACVLSCQHVYFFQLTPVFSLIKVHRNHNCVYWSDSDFKTLHGSVSYVEPNFYVFCSGFKGYNISHFNVYDRNGNFVESIERANMLDIDFPNTHPICYFNGAFIVSASEMGKFVLI